MTTTTLESTIHQSLINLWNEHKGKPYTQRNPHFYPTLRRNPTLLFIGLNASFSDKEFQLLKGTEFAHVAEDPETFYSFTRFQHNIISTIQKIDELARQSYNVYFGPIRKLTTQISINASWENIDLFYVRNTDQKSIKKTIEDLEKESPKFLNSQIQLAPKLIHELAPKILIINNAYGSRLFEQAFGHRLSWHESLGVHFFDEKLPIFFSSMLSNGATDTGTRKRLEWHIRYVMKNHYPNDPL